MQIHAEILANAANLKQILKLCRLGKVATAEVGELSGNDNLSQIDPEDTKLLNLSKGPHGSSLLIEFAVANKDKSFNVTISTRTGIIYITMLIVMAIVTLTSVYKICSIKQNGDKRKLPEKDYDSPSPLT